MNRKRLFFVVGAVVVLAAAAWLSWWGATRSPFSLEVIKNRLRRAYPEVSHLSTDHLARLLKGPAPYRPLLLDARSAPEYEVSHLPGARFAGTDTALTRALAGLSKDQPLVVYCAVGGRSSRLALRLSHKGYRKVANLEGSIFQWANEGRPLWRGGRAVRRVHQWTPRLGKLLRPELRAPWPARSYQ